MFLLYMVVIFFIVLSMFVTIINEAFAAVCDDTSKQSNEYEMVDFMMSRFKQWTGLSGLARKLGKGNPGDDKLSNSKVPNVMLCYVTCIYRVHAPNENRNFSELVRYFIKITLKGCLHHTHTHTHLNRWFISKPCKNIKVKSIETEC